MFVAGGEVVISQIDGIIVYVNNAPGHIASVQDPVVKMIDPTEMRIVGRIQEDKGLNEIKVGQRVVFTADAFPSNQYVAVVDSIGETARQIDIVFNISDKREENEFEVRALFDSSAYPELKTGMSAKMWVYK